MMNFTYTFLPSLENAFWYEFMDNSECLILRPIKQNENRNRGQGEEYNVKNK